MRGWLERLGWSRTPERRAMVLAGGGVIGGMYEVGALAALDELPGFRANDFDLYVGSSAGSVVGALMANGVRPAELYAILDEERDDPLNFQKGAVYHKGSFSGAARNLAQFVWAIGKRAVTDFRLEWPDLLARSGGDMPPGFFSLAPLEAYVREALLAKGLSNDFAGTPRPLLIAAIALDQAERVVFGSGDVMDVPISQAIAASSAIPGFFEPYRIRGRDYVDGDGEAIIRVALARRTLEILKSVGDPTHAAEVAQSVLVEEGRGQGGLIVMDWRGRMGWARSTVLMPVGLMSPGRAEPELPF